MATSSIDPDWPLVCALQEGDENALTPLIQKYQQPLFRFICRYIRDEETARDLLQETFVRLYFNARKFKPRAKFSTWLHAIAANLCRDYARSKKYRTERAPLNGDGFGVGWYGTAADINPTPCVFTSLTPAWSNQNLRRLSEHVKSCCFFAHVRSASSGMRVCEANCHPFQHGRFLWMHNGTIEGFWKIKRRLHASLPDQLYNAIEGTTDSEHAFAVFLQVLGDTERACSANEMGQALVHTIAQLERWTAEGGFSAPSYYNFAVTDGQSVAAVRYVSDPTKEPASLYYSAGGKYQCTEGACQFIECHESERTVIIASEQLNENPTDWIRVAPNHVLTVTQELTVNVELMDVQRLGPTNT